MFSLRDYQNDCVSGVRKVMRRGEPALMVLPTGGGKTVVFSYITERVRSKNKRVYIFAHRREIVRQISRSLREMGVKHGMIMPGFTPTPDLVQVGMIQTAGRRLDRLPAPNLIIIDEAHHTVAGMWAKVVKHFSKAVVLGVTATPERLDGKGLGSFYKHMVEGPTTRWLIEQGFLSRFRYLAPPSAVDLSDVRTQMGDYKKDDARKAVDKPTITGDAVDHYEKFLNGAPAVAFCIDIEHANHVADAFRSRGWRADVIEGSQDPSTREGLVSDLGSGRLHVLVSCEIISEGFDLPAVMGAILLRPTKSLVMYLQQVGRALRPVYAKGAPLDTLEQRHAAMTASHKPFAVILDHVGNVQHHGPPNLERKWALEGRPKNSKASGPGVRVCSDCFRVYGQGDKIECSTPDTCPLLNSDGRERPEQVDGSLVDMSPDEDWTGGIPLDADPKSEEGRELVSRAQTLPQLRELAKQRNYRRGWATNVWRGRSKDKTLVKGQPE